MSGEHVKRRRATTPKREIEACSCAAQPAPRPSPTMRPAATGQGIACVVSRSRFADGGSAAGLNGLMVPNRGREHDSRALTRTKGREKLIFKWTPHFFGTS